MAINAPTVVPAVITAIPIKVATNNIILTNIIVLKSGHIQQLQQHLFLNSILSNTCVNNKPKSINTVKPIIIPVIINIIGRKATIVATVITPVNAKPAIIPPINNAIINGQKLNLQQLLSIYLTPFHINIIFK